MSEAMRESYERWCSAVAARNIALAELERAKTEIEWLRAERLLLLSVAQKDGLTHE